MKLKFKKAQKTLVVASMLAITLLQCRSQTPDTLRVSVNSWVGFGPLYVAMEAGIFEAHNLSVEIITMENAPDRRAALIAGRVHVLGSTLDDLAVSLSQNVDAMAFGCADFSNGGDGIVGSNGVSTLSDLLEAEIAVQPGFVNHFFLLYVLHKNGLPITDLNISPMTPDDAGAAFLTGSVDAAVTWEPHLSEAVERRPGTVRIVDSKAYPEAILDLFVASRQWVQDNQEQVGAFQKAWDDAVTYTEQRPDEAYGIIANQLGFEPQEVGQMLSGAQLLTNHDCTTLLEPILPDLASDVEEIWTTAGYVTRDIQLENSVRLP